MRRLRVSATMRKQLVDLRDERGKARRGGVMRVPAIMGVDEWEAIAAVSQDALIAASAEDRTLPTERPVVTGKDPADVSDRYKPSTIR